MPLAINLKQKMRLPNINRRKLLLAVGGLVLASVILQLLYPGAKTLPRQKVGGVSVGSMDASALHNKLAATDQEMKINLTLGDNSQQVAWRDLGITIDQEAVIADALNYPVSQKLIPFSSLYRIFFHDNDLKTHTDEATLQAYAERLATENYKDPANASLSVSGTSVIRQDQKSGLKYEPAQIAEQIKKTPYNSSASMSIKGMDVPPAFSAAEIEEVARKAEAIIATEIKVDVAGAVQAVPKEEIAAWLKFTETKDVRKIAIDADQEKIKTYLDKLNKPVYKAPGTMTITTRDGKELQRTADTSGQSIDMANGSKLLAGATLAASPATHKLPITKIPPKITYQRSYTKSQAGFSALLTDLAAEEADMSISLRALDGSGIVASAKGSKQFAPASTYKLSVAYSAIKRIEAGTMQWSDNVNGRSVEKCITDMIVISDNPCASALGDKIGWQAITDEARAIGMGRTNLAKGFVSTSDDQAVFLARLHQGSLMNGSNREKLLGLMKQQKYRAGIPAGTSGAVVADKVGFIGGLLHDSAIVYGPQGTYVLVIYSNKSSWPRLAAVTSKIHSLMNQ